MRMAPMSSMRRGTLQLPSATVRYTLPEIITCRWHACAGAIDGHGTSRPLPAYGGKSSGTTWVWISMQSWFMLEIIESTHDPLTRFAQCCPVHLRRAGAALSLAAGEDHRAFRSRRHRRHARAPRRAEALRPDEGELRHREQGWRRRRRRLGARGEGAA